MRACGLQLNGGFSVRMAGSGWPIRDGECAVWDSGDRRRVVCGVSAPRMMSWMGVLASGTNPRGEKYSGTCEVLIGSLGVALHCADCSHLRDFLHHPDRLQG